MPATHPRTASRLAQERRPLARTRHQGRQGPQRHPSRPARRPVRLLSGEDRYAFAALDASVTFDWGPRDAFERSDSGAFRCAMELVASMWRQDRLRALELATLTVAATQSPLNEATGRKLTTFARYGARIDKDLCRALQTLRVLRDRSDEWVDELRNGTSEPDEPEP